ncbi:isoflavone 2'-hydroxylase-like protein [Tanacetum coccineum]|uniref:Isoflavone 2'-hydroxylase-like protein n=1 Tax=Tanacetum coccineum TaxID=301880 RepID=A0ABQ5FZZ2_9ASTR
MAFSDSFLFLLTLAFGEQMLVVIQNDPKIWKDPERFKPERFVDVEGQMDGFKFMPFGSGRRGCPGEAMAMRMVGLTLGTLLQYFVLERIGVEKLDMSEGACDDGNYRGNCDLTQIEMPLSKYNIINTKDTE